MRRVEAEALVGASREEVWDLYDDIAGWPRWLPMVRDVVYVSGPAAAGTVYRERTRIGGVGGVEQWEIVEHRHPTRQVHLTASSTLVRRLVITFEARGTGTWVHQAVELSSRLPGPLGWLHESVAVLPVGPVLRNSVAAAKRVFEEAPR